MATFDLAGNQDDYYEHVNNLRKVIEYQLSDEKITRILEESDRKRISLLHSHGEQCKEDFKKLKRKLLGKLTYLTDKGKTPWKVDLYHRMYNYCIFLRDSRLGRFSSCYLIEDILDDISGHIKICLEDTWGSFHEQRTPHATTVTQFIYDSCLLGTWLKSRGFKGLKVNIGAIVPEPLEKYKNAVRVVYTEEPINVAIDYNDKEF